VKPFSILSLLLLSTVSGTAFASLGGTIDSIDRDQTAIRATHRTMRSASPLFTVHEIQSTGLTMKEFVGQNGVIFAISWSGNRHPEIAEVLGTYADEFRQADASSRPPPGARSRQLLAPRMRLHTWGHTRHLQGRVFDPDLMPKGVDIREIR
jgi:hypothetical protein